MGITDRSRAGFSKAEKIRQANAKVAQLQDKAKTSTKPTKADILAKIDMLRSQAADIDCEVAYNHLMSRIHELSGQL